MKSFDSNSTKRVSYILTTRNKAKFLDRALQNYRQLVRVHDELIIIDGGSTDGTETIIKKFRDFVDIFVSEPDLNSAHALNKGMLLARGKYIKHLTDDDVIYPEAMEEAIKVMEKHPEVDILICGGTKQRGRNFTVFYVPEGVNYGNDIISDILKYGSCGVGQVIRRKSLAVSRLYPLDTASDFTFPIECVFNGLVVKFCRINLFHHPIYDHSTIIAKEKEYRLDYDKTLSEYLSFGNYMKYKFQRIWPHWSSYTEKLYKKLPLTKSLLAPMKAFLGINGGKMGKRRESASKYNWDGGFS